MITYVYLAAPYSKGCPSVNTHNAIFYAEELAANDFVPFIPHLSHLWNAVAPHPYEWWMQYDFSWIERCDALLRISGESPGADREVLHAKSLGIPVFFSIEDLLAAREALH